MTDVQTGFVDWLWIGLESEAAVTFVQNHTELVIIVVAVAFSFLLDAVFEAPRFLANSARWLGRSQGISKGQTIAKRLRMQSGARFATLVAPFERDDDGALSRLVTGALDEHTAAFLFDRSVAREDLPVRLDGARDSEAARQWSLRADADLIVWGQAGKSDRLWRIYFLTARARAGNEPIQEIRIIPPQDPAEAERLARGIAYIFARVALPCAEEADRYRPEKLHPVLDALDLLIAAPPRGLGDEFERLLRRDAASIALSVGQREGDGDALRRASRLRVRILAEIDRARDPQGWAVARADVGRVHLAIGEREGDVRRLSAAAEAFDEAASLFGRLNLLDSRADTLVSTARSIFLLAEAERDVDGFQSAVDAARAALEATQGGDPRLEDKARHVLGQALQALGDASGNIDILNEALAEYKSAANDRVRGVDPLRWAQIQHDLGLAHAAMGARLQDHALYDEAITDYRAALKERTRHIDLAAWGDTMTQMGHALFAVGKVEPKSGALEAAVRTFTEVLEHRPRDDSPYDWAQAKNNLGNALQAIGERDNDRESLQRAVVAYRDALQELPPSDYPVEWAGTQNNLGNALHVLGEEGRDPDALEAALAAHREALEIRTREEMRVDWAATRNNMGLVLTTLGVSLRDPHRLEEAVDAYRDALGVFRLAGEARYAAMAERNLERAKDLLAQNRSGTTYYGSAARPS